MTPKFIPLVKLTKKPSAAETRYAENSRDCYEIFRQLFDPEEIDVRECAFALFLNQRNRVIAAMELSRGSICYCQMDPKMLYAAALQCFATGVVVAHNHPSGDRRPSHEDKILTKKLKQAAMLLEICFTDHLILTADGYFSMLDNGLLSDI